MKSNPRPIQAHFWTPGTLVMLAFMLGAAVVLIFRYTKGLGYVTNLNNAYACGLWIAFDVA